MNHHKKVKLTARGGKGVHIFLVFVYQVRGKNMEHFYIFNSGVGGGG